MTDLPPARSVRRAPGPNPEGARWHGLVTLTHDERLLRRRRLVTAHDEGFLVDLPRATRVEERDGFDLGDGRLVEVIAAEERLIEVRVPETQQDPLKGGPAGRVSLARLAWHIGNRHCPCQVEPDRLLIPSDRILREMLLGLGAAVEDVSEPFYPEGGAYDAAAGHAHPSGGADHGDLGGLARDPP